METFADDNVDAFIIYLDEVIVAVTDHSRFSSVARCNWQLRHEQYNGVQVTTRKEIITFFRYS